MVLSGWWDNAVYVRITESETGMLISQSFVASAQRITSIETDFTGSKPFLQVHNPCTEEFLP